MAYTTVDDPSEYFTITLYTGNGSDDRSITNSANAGNFKPDWLWIKERDQTRHHIFNDSNRGATKNINSSLTNAESTGADGIQAFETNGFQLGTDADVNLNTGTYVAWQWKANGGTINETRTESGVQPAFNRQTNLEAGFSIVTYTGVGTNSGSSEHPAFLHGLGAKPEFAIFKNRSSSADWAIWFNAINSAGSNVFQGFDTGAHGGSGGASHFGDAAPNTTSFFLGGVPTDDGTASTRTNTDGDNYVCYLFIPIKGYSKFGSYTGNGNSDGTFVYTGFKPAWIMYKNSSSSSNWIIRDNKRTTSSGTNPNGTVLLPNSSNAESTNDSATAIDLLSNGFKIRNTENNDNTSGNVYAYAAFAEHPFVSSQGVPTTAR